MKFALNSDHREYFQKHQAIEFEGLLTPAQLQQVEGAIKEVLSLRIGLQSTLFGKTTPEKLFAAGRDLWRDSEILRKVVTQPRLAEIAAELSEQKKLRLGYDEYLPAPEIPLGKVSSPDPYHSLLTHKFSLTQRTALQGVACGLILCLKGLGEGEEVLTPFPKQAGHGVFFTPEYPIDFQELYQRRGHAYLLIVFVRHNAVYIQQPQDPHAQAFNTVGYALGDKLNDKWNPMVYR